MIARPIAVLLLLKSDKEAQGPHLMKPIPAVDIAVKQQLGEVKSTD
jgi:hypothetical protein